MNSGVASSDTSAETLLGSLERAGLIQRSTARITPLPGGVSSEIYLVEDGRERFVVKRALAKLRVKDDWFADISRGRTEEAFLRYVGTRFPAAVPRVLASDPTAGWFAMEFLGDEFATWKSRLMQGHADTADAHRAGATLGQIHRASWDDSTTAAQFATDENFRQLRVDPYLETTACRVPGMATWLRAEAARLQMTKRALVHGDFSPKNLMVAPDRFVILDAEVAWFGDPAFDTAFVLTHLFLKALLQGQKSEACLASARMFWSTYTLTLGPGADSALEARTTHLLLCLLLARVHGKSPVEYLTQPAQQKLVIDFASAWLPQPPLSLADTLTAWRKCLQHS